VRSGLRVEQADEVRDALGLSPDAMERLLGSSTRTVQRRRERGEALSPSESDRLWRLLFIRSRANEALGSEAGARLWLTSPHPLLGGETPVQRLDTEPGLREVEDMLTVIDETAAA
jgi:putative toxin-antitoxin system antitoxin component (TIGR02293 family)